MIERLERMYALVWHERDLDAAFEGIPDDFEWVVPGHPDGDVHRGRSAALDFFRDWSPVDAGLWSRWGFPIG